MGWGFGRAVDPTSLGAETGPDPYFIDTHKCVGFGGKV